MLKTGIENSPTKSFEEALSKSLTENRRIANSGQRRGKLKFSFHNGLNPLFFTIAVFAFL